MIPFKGISGIDQELIWQTGCFLRGLTFSKKEEGWLLTVKITDRQGDNRVAFVFADTPENCLELVWSAMTTTSITLRWREDKWKNS